MFAQLSTQVPSVADGLATESIIDAQQRIAEQFGMLESSVEQYDHLISLGRSLAPMAEDLKLDGNHLRDCRGEAWLAGGFKNDLLYLSAAAESDMIAGLLSIAVDVYSGHTSEEILAHPISAGSLGLTGCLSPHRLSCFEGIAQRVRNLAMLARVQGRA